MPIASCWWPLLIWVWLSPLSPMRCLYILMRSLLSLLIFRLNSPSSLGVSLHKGCANLFILFIDLHWIHSSQFLSFLYLEAQLWGPYSRRDLTSSEHKGKITSLDLLSTLPNVAQEIAGLFLLQGCTADSWSACCPSGPKRLLCKGWGKRIHNGEGWRKL